MTCNGAVPRTSREVEHAAPAPLPDAGRLPTPDVASRVLFYSDPGRDLGEHAVTLRAIRSRDAAILARLDAALQAEANGGGDMGAPLVLAIGALRAELRGGAT